MCISTKKRINWIQTGFLHLCKLATRQNKRENSHHTSKRKRSYLTSDSKEPLLLLLLTPPDLPSTEVVDVAVFSSFSPPPTTPAAAAAEVSSCMEAFSVLAGTESIRSNVCSGTPARGGAGEKEIPMGAEQRTERDACAHFCASRGVSPYPLRRQIVTCVVRALSPDFITPRSQPLRSIQHDVPGAQSSIWRRRGHVVKKTKLTELGQARKSTTHIRSMKCQRTWTCNMLSCVCSTKC